MIKYKEKLPKYLQYFALILIGSSVFGFGLLSSVLKDESFDFDFAIFIIIMILVHLVVGGAILSKKHWGLLIFKTYLYLLFLAIPIGTYIASKTLKYIKHNKVNRLYQ